MIWRRCSRLGWNEFEEEIEEWRAQNLHSPVSAERESRFFYMSESVFDEFPVLETERLLLRAVRPSDVTAVYAIFLTRK